MIRRSSLIALEIILGFFAGLLILAGVSVWRLSSGPVHLDFLTPYLEAAFEDPESDLQVEVGETVLTWEGWPRNVDLRARRMRVRDSDGRVLATVPDISVTLSTRALARGLVAPTSVEVIGASVLLVREADGRIRLGSAEPVDRLEASEAAAEEADISQVLPSILDDFASPTDPDKPQAYLEVVRISAGRLYLRDEVLDIDWRAPNAELELRRDEAGLAGEVTLDLAQAGPETRLEAAFIYERSSRFVDLAASVSDLRPAALASLSPEFEALGALDVAIRGTASATIGIDGSIEAVEFQIRGKDGVISLPDRLPEPRPFQQLALAGKLDGAAGRLEIGTVQIDFGDAQRPGPRVALSGALSRSENGPGYRLEGEARLIDLKLDELPLYWPLGLDDDAREWVVENIRTGTAEETELAVALTLPDRDFENAQLEAFGGTFKYRDLDVHFLRPLPPVVDVSGRARFDRSSLSFAIAGGRLDELVVRESEAVISGFDGDAAEQMAIDLNVDGPLRDALALLNHERLGLVDKLGLDPASAAGQASARVSFRFPLLESLEFEDVRVAASSELRQVSIGQLLLGQDARQGDLSLELDNDGMRSQGRLRLGGVPIEVDWTESFDERQPQRSLYRVLVPEMDDAARKRFGFDVWEGLSGPLAASVVAAQGFDGRAQVNLALNLQAARLEAPEIHWSKAAGEAGEARLSLVLNDGRLSEVPSFEIQAGSLRTTGRGRFDESGQQLTWVEMADLAFNETALRQVTVRREGEALDIRIGAGRLDATAFLAKDAKDESGDPAVEEAEPEKPLRLIANALATLTFSPGRYLEDASLVLDRSATGWNRIELHGQVPRALWAEDESAQGSSGDEGGQPKRIDLTYGPDGSGQQRLQATAFDVGAVLRAMDILDTMHGGALELSGQHLVGQPLEAEIQIDDFKVIEAPVLARLLLVASLTGIVEGLTSDGIEFDRLTGSFTLSDSVLSTKLIRAYGSSLGLTTKGDIDLGQSRLDLSGTIVPAYLLNRILNNIPVLGTILTGGEGGGVVAFVYDVEGALEEPEVSVNPLSALAPGFLRGVFSGEGIDEDEPTVFPTGNER